MSLLDHAAGPRSRATPSKGTSPRTSKWHNFGTVVLVALRVSRSPTMSPSWEIGGLAGSTPRRRYDPYSAGLRRRVLPTLGHLPVAMITAGLVDRAIDQWETEFGRSTIKNTVSALVLVLDEAVRDGIIPRNPAKDRARRRTVGRSSGNSEPSTPRDLALAQRRHP